jgi:precorrin-2/cobalt-factor-2 C20-methyltransferase
LDNGKIKSANSRFTQLSLYVLVYVVPQFIVKEAIMAGIFYGVGVGPGDPELLTLKAVEVIRNADVVIAPKTEKKEGSTALSIAHPYLKADVEILRLVFPMVNDAVTLANAWENNKNSILAELQAGKKVVFLTLGDPMFYSTYMYVYRLLKDSGYAIETIPGVPAFCAIGSQLGQPLAEGNDILSIIPATMSEEELDAILGVVDNVVLMKVYKNFGQVVEKLKQHGFGENSVMISRCGLPDEQISYNLEDVDAKSVNYLSTILAKKRKLG